MFTFTERIRRYGPPKVEMEALGRQLKNFMKHAPTLQESLGHPRQYTYDPLQDAIVMTVMLIERKDDEDDVVIHDTINPPLSEVPVFKRGEVE